MLPHGKLKNGGSTDDAAVFRRIFLPYLAELDNSKSFETYLFYLK